MNVHSGQVRSANTAPHRVYTAGDGVGADIWAQRGAGTSSLGECHALDCAHVTWHVARNLL